jgi:hypothetical protein
VARYDRCCLNRINKKTDLDIINELLDKNMYNKIELQEILCDECYNIISAARNETDANV